MKTFKVVQDKETSKWRCPQCGSINDKEKNRKADHMSSTIEDVYLEIDPHDSGCFVLVMDALGFCCDSIKKLGETGYYASRQTRVNVGCWLCGFVKN